VGYFGSLGSGAISKRRFYLFILLDWPLLVGSGIYGCSPTVITTVSASNGTCTARLAVGVRSPVSSTVIQVTPRSCRADMRAALLCRVIGEAFAFRPTMIPNAAHPTSCWSAQESGIVLVHLAWCCKISWSIKGTRTESESLYPTHLFTVNFWPANGSKLFFSRSLFLGSVIELLVGLA
jgi:hypothetical protein